MADVARKVGRGGAGNFYTRKGIADIESKQDLEAQITTQETNSTPKETYIRAGRGGAGNWHEPSVASQTADDQTTKVITSSTTSAPTQVTTSKLGMTTGRGGAGNWFESASTREKREAEEEQRRKGEEERVERMVRESIEAQLTKPPKTYGCGSERGVRVGKSRFGLTSGDEAGL